MECLPCQGCVGTMSEGSVPSGLVELMVGSVLGATGVQGWDQGSGFSLLRVQRSPFGASLTFHSPKESLHFVGAVGFYTESQWSGQICALKSWVPLHASTWAVLSDNG